MCEHPNHVPYCSYDKPKDNPNRDYNMEDVPLGEFFAQETLDGVFEMKGPIDLSEDGTPVIARPERFGSRSAIKKKFEFLKSQDRNIYLYKAMWHSYDGLHYWVWYASKVRTKPE